MLPRMILRERQRYVSMERKSALVRLLSVLGAIPLRLGINLDTRSTMVPPHMNLHPATSQPRH